MRKVLGIPSLTFWAVVSPLGVFGIHYVSAAGQWAMASPRAFAVPVEPSFTVSIPSGHQSLSQGVR